jgi:hypothetical protein
MSLFNLNVVDALSQEIARIGGSFVYAIPSDMINSPQGPVTYTVTLGDGSPLPLWLNYNPTTHIISGVPTTGSDGTYSILVTADDGVQIPVQGTLSLIVGPNAAPKVANPLSNQVAQVGHTFRLAVPDNTFADPNGDTLILRASRVNGRALPSWLTFSDRTLSGKPGPSNTGTFGDKTYPLAVCASDGDEEACSVFDLSVQGKSYTESALTVFGPLATMTALGVGWYKKRGLILNPWNRKKYTQGTEIVKIAESFQYQIKTPQDKIELVKAYKGQRMFASLPAPKSLDRRSYLEWLKVDAPMAAGTLLPRWLEYDHAENQLLSSSGPSQNDAGLYTVRFFGKGEVILEEVRLNVGNQNERAKNSRRGSDQHTVPLLEMNSL